MNISCYDVAERFIGIQEIPGKEDSPQILTMLRLDTEWPKNDEVPWCSAFVNYVAWLLRLPRSKSLLARSWLDVGRPIDINQAIARHDVVILSRGQNQPGPDNKTAPGHVGFYAAHDSEKVYILGGNQSDSISIKPYPLNRVLGVRRLYSCKRFS